MRSTSDTTKTNNEYNIWKTRDFICDTTEVVMEDDKILHQNIFEIMSASYI